MADLPSGTVTFLFTDIEGSTPLWEREPEQMRLALARHDAILRTAIATHGGHAYKTIGDAFQAAFAFPAHAVAAALAAQRAFAAQAWETSDPVRVRMGVAYRSGGGGGQRLRTTHTLNRVARIMAAGHGGQILLSGEVADLVRRDLPADVTLRDMGKQRMKGLTHLEHLFQLVAPDLPAAFPPLKTLDTLPTQPAGAARPASIGREQEIAAVCAVAARADAPAHADRPRRHRQDPPGAARRRRACWRPLPDGVWLVELAPLADPALVPQAVASALGLREEAGRPLLATLTDFLRARSLLLLLDNCEHLVEACAQLADALLRACPQRAHPGQQPRGAGHRRRGALPRALAGARPTRASLPPLEALAQYEAVQLFVERARGRAAGLYR